MFRLSRSGKVRLPGVPEKSFVTFAASKQADTSNAEDLRPSAGGDCQTRDLQLRPGDVRLVTCRASQGTRRRARVRLLSIPELACTHARARVPVSLPCFRSMSGGGEPEHSFVRHAARGNPIYAAAFLSPLPVDSPRLLALPRGLGKRAGGSRCIRVSAAGTLRVAREEKRARRGGDAGAYASPAAVQSVRRGVCVVAGRPGGERAPSLQCDCQVSGGGRTEFL